MMNDTTLTILIAEDNPAAKVLLTRFLSQQNYSLIHADNGQETVDLYRQHKPDIVLSDVNMPIMGGLEAISQIRAMTKNYWVPVLVLSAYDQSTDLIKAFEAGADDYLAKPINLDILQAKINVMQRLINLQRANQSSIANLRTAQLEIEHDQLLAKDLAAKMLSMGDLLHPTIEYWLQPTLQFSGDLIAARQAVGGKLYIMLADSTGHGLSASLPNLIISRTFHSMTKKGFNLSSIVTEMNTSAKTLLTANRFVALNLFAIDFRHKTIECWCGGLPDSYLINAQGHIINRFKSEHLAIGILPAESFDSTTQFWHWQESVEILAYTDGLLDAPSPEGTLFGEDMLLNIIQKNQIGSRVEELKQAALDHIKDSHSSDDISVLTIQCN